MESFNWGRCFETGLSDVDNQHHHLINLINQFGNLLTNNDIAMEDVDRLYRELSDYAIYHFQEEEKLMHGSKLDPRHTQSHIKIHKSFLDELSSIYSGISIDNIEQAKSFLKFLTHWIAFHLLGQDQDMAKQIRLITSGMTPADAYDARKKEQSLSTEPLIGALNGLFDLVTIRNKELKQLNDSLEEKVALRTQELFDANLRLKEMSLTDPLTALPNRRHAINYLSSVWQESITTQEPLTCIMIDADHFKEVNDTYGHDAGDIVLKELAAALKHSFRTDDLVCRLGGDEFFVICPKTNTEDGLLIAESCRMAISTLRVPTGGEPWCGSISIGVASRLTSMKAYEDIIKVADKGVYEAKKAGKNCVRLV